MDGTSGYTLMHGDVEVAGMSLHDDTGTIHEIDNVSDPAHLPVGVVRDGMIDGGSLRRWWRRRSIPTGRTVRMNRTGPSPVTYLNSHYIRTRVKGNSSV